MRPCHEEMSQCKCWSGDKLKHSRGRREDLSTKTEASNQRMAPIKLFGQHWRTSSDDLVSSCFIIIHIYIYTWDEDESNISLPLGVPCHVWIVRTTGLGGNSHSSHNLPRPGDLDVAGFEILTEYVNQTTTFIQCLGAEYGETTLYLSITLAILVLTCLNQVTVVGINKYFKNSSSC